MDEDLILEALKICFDELKNESKSSSKDELENELINYAKRTKM